MPCSFFKQIGLAIVLLFAACKKQEAVYPYTGITRFAIKDAAGNELRAVVQQDEILVYWPPFQAVPDSIRPEILLQQRATIQPASGAGVPFKGSTTWMVTAESGATSQYRLKPVINQPDPKILIDAPVTNGVYETQQGALFPYIRAEYLVPDSNNTRINFIAANGQPVNMNRFCSTLSQSQVVMTIPTSMDTGRYSIRITSGIHSFTSEHLLFVNYPLPGVLFPWPTTGHRGDQLVFTLQPGSRTITGLQMRLLSDDKYYPLTLIGQTNNALTVQIPPTFPTGTYYYFKIISDAYPNGIEQFIGPAARRLKVN